MAKKNITSTGPVDCACVIHSDKYDWVYVERLYNMIRSHSSREIRFHVYTESRRPVPTHMIKHSLDNWAGISGPKKSWWYKLQLFNPVHHAGPMLYFDLDCVIVRDIDWMFELNPDKLWCLRDFRYLQSEAFSTVNSSIMWFDTRVFEYVWAKFSRENIGEVVRAYPGDQDYIGAVVNYNDRRFFPDKHFQSYRWQVRDGGYDFVTRQHKKPESGSAISDDCTVVVFHGDPKPHEVKDPQIVTLWH